MHLAMCKAKRHYVITGMYARCPSYCGHDNMHALCWNDETATLLYLTLSLITTIHSVGHDRTKLAVLSIEAVAPPAERCNACELQSPQCWAAQCARSTGNNSAGCSALSTPCSALEAHSKVAIAITLMYIEAPHANT